MARSFWLYTGCAGGPEGAGAWGGGDDMPPKPPSRSFEAACGGGRDCVGAGEVDGPLLNKSIMLATFDCGVGDVV